MASASSAVSTTTASTRPASATTATAFRLRPRFVYHQVATAKILAVERVYGAIGVFIVGYFHEGESAGLAGEAVTNEIHAGGSHADLSKPLVKLFFGCGKREITDIELLHLRTLLSEPHCEPRSRTEETSVEYGQSRGRATADADRDFSGQ